MGGHKTGWLPLIAAAAVLLPGCGGGSDESEPPQPVVEIKAFQFGPDPIEVEPGTTVKWENGDQTTHTVTGKGFDGKLGEGGTFEHTFDKPGTYRYICKLHSGPGMKGVVKVTGDPTTAKVAVTHDEWKIETSATRLQAGPLDLVERNAGETEHELLVVRTNRAADEIPVGLEGVRPSLAGRVVVGREHSAHQHGAKAGRYHHLKPGATRRRRVRLAPGRYVLLCSIPGHYQAGQRLSVDVRRA